MGTGFGRTDKVKGHRIVEKERNRSPPVILYSRTFNTGLDENTSKGTFGLGKAAEKNRHL